MRDLYFRSCHFPQGFFMCFNVWSLQYFMHIVTLWIDAFSGISIISELVVELISQALLEEEHNLRGEGGELYFYECTGVAHQCRPVFSSCALTSVLTRLWPFLPYLTWCFRTPCTLEQSSHGWITFQDLPNLCGMLGFKFGTWSSPWTPSLPKRMGMLTCRWWGCRVGG